MNHMLKPFIIPLSISTPVSSFSSLSLSSTSRRASSYESALCCAWSNSFCNSNDNNKRIFHNDGDNNKKHKEILHPMSLEY